MHIVLTINENSYIIFKKTEVKMPVVSEFHGMRIYMYFSDNDRHHKPHIHVIYGEYEAVVGIDGELLESALPNKQFRILSAWLAIHENELYSSWAKAVKNVAPGKIEPLR